MVPEKDPENRGAAHKTIRDANTTPRKFILDTKQHALPGVDGLLE